MDAKTNAVQELRGKDFSFIRFKAKYIFNAREPVFFFPIKADSETSPSICDIPLEVGKRISVTRDEEVTPMVDVLVVKQ